MADATLFKFACLTKAVMKKLILPILLVLIGAQVKAQYYFPPKTGNIWDTMSPNELGWCQDSINSLYQFLDDGKTKGFMVLKDGKIVLEQILGTHTFLDGLCDFFWYYIILNCYRSDDY